MEFLCRHCGYNFKKTLTLKEKNERYKPKFCSKECAQTFTVNKIKKRNKIIASPRSSKEEKIFGEMIKSFFPQLKSQYKIKNYDHHYDFYCPELDLIIEYNGEYWHNKPRNKTKDRKHLNEATRQNIQVAVVTDKEWKLFMSGGLPTKKSISKLLSYSIKNDI